MLLSSTTSCPGVDGAGLGCRAKQPRRPCARPPPSHPLPLGRVATPSQREHPACGFEGKITKNRKQNQPPPYVSKKRSRRGAERGRSERPPRGAPQGTRTPRCSHGVPSGGGGTRPNAPGARRFGGWRRCCFSAVKDSGDITDGSTCPDSEKGRKERERIGRRDSSKTGGSGKPQKEEGKEGGADGGRTRWWFGIYWASRYPRSIVWGRKRAAGGQGWVYLGSDAAPRATSVPQGWWEWSAASLRREDVPKLPAPSPRPPNANCFEFSRGELTQEAAAANCDLQGWWPTSSQPH